MEPIIKQMCNSIKNYYFNEIQDYLIYMIAYLEKYEEYKELRELLDTIRKSI